MIKGFRFNLLLVFLCFFCVYSAHSNAVNALKVGLKRNSGKDQAMVLQNILKKYTKIYIPKGTYMLSVVKVPSNRTILTDGYQTKFQHMKGMVGNMLIFEGVTNIAIQKFSVEGTFISEPNRNTEFLNLVNIRGGCSKIKLDGIKASNAWGDGLLITGNPKIVSRNPTNIEVKEVITSNIYRNGISIVGGINLNFGSIYTEKSGLSGFDIEAEGAIIDGVNVKFFDGDTFRITGRNKGSVKNIHIGSAYLDAYKSLGGSKIYKSFIDFPDKQLHGIIICGENISIETLSVKNFPGAALIVVNKTRSKNLKIREMIVSNCCRNYIENGLGVPYYLVNNSPTPLNITFLTGNLKRNVNRVRLLKSPENIIVKFIKEKKMDFK